MGHEEGTIMSTAPFAIFVILGGVANVRLRIVGWILKGLTPLMISFEIRYDPLCTAG